MDEPRIETFYAERGDRATFQTLYLPAAGGSALGYVLCPAFGEEAECARRNFHELARALAADGVHVLVPDLLGTGNSSGEMKDVALADWSEDLLGGAVRLRERCGVRRLGLVGLRFGCMLALLVAARLEEVADVVLWDPPWKPERDFRALLRKKLVREAWTQGAVSKTRDELLADAAAGGVLDLDGYRVSSRLVEELRELRWERLATIERPGLRAAVALFSRRERQARLCEKISGVLRGVVPEPLDVEPPPRFWTRIAPVIAEPLIAATCAWTQTRQEGEPSHAA